MIALAVLTLLALVVMWPGGDDGGFEDPLVLDADPVDATITSVDLAACSFSPADRCALATFDLTSGIVEGETGAIEQLLPWHARRR